MISKHKRQKSIMLKFLGFILFSVIYVCGVCVSIVVGESCKRIISASAAGVMGGYEMPHVRPGMETLLSLLPSSNIIFENYLIFYNQFLKKAMTC